MAVRASPMRDPTASTAHDGAMKRSSFYSLLPAALWLLVCLAHCPRAAFAAAEAAVVDDAMRRHLQASIAAADSFEDRFDAEVWLMTQSTALARLVKDPQTRMEMLRLVHREATRVDLPPNMVLAVIHVESLFNPYAVSRAGALGMMQVMPFWKKELGRDTDNLIDLETNLRYGCTILKYYLDRERGRWPEALARYNGSYGKYWYPERVMNAWQKYYRW